MDVAGIYDLAREWTGTDSTNMPDTKLVKFANIAYHAIEKAIVTRVNEDFFYQEWTSDIVSGQREYTLPAKSATVDGCKKLLSVAIKYKSTDMEFTKLIETRLTNFSDDLSQLEDKDLPQYYIADNSIFLLQEPTESITGGLKLYGVMSLKDIATSGAESTVRIPIEYHELIPLGMEYLIYKSRRLTNDKNDAKVEFLQEINTMVSELSDRNAGPNTIKLPSLNSFA